MPNDAVHEANRRRQATVDALTAARTREQEIKRRLGFAHSQGLETSAIRKDLTAVREEIETLDAALPAHDEAIKKAQLEADAEKFAPLYAQLQDVLAQRAAAAEQLALLGADFTAGIATLMHLANQSVQLSLALGNKDAAKASFNHLMPHWLCALIMPFSPGGAQEWPSTANPQYVQRGLVALDAELCERGNLR
jgi:chromosome segregation ATPase